MNPIDSLKLLLAVVTAPKGEKGAAMVEYALLVALIAVVVMVALRPLGTAISNAFANITASL